MKAVPYEQHVARMTKTKASLRAKLRANYVRHMKRTTKAAPAPMTGEQLLAALGELQTAMTGRYDELQTKMRELGSAAAEVNVLRIQVQDLINKAKAQ